MALVRAHKRGWAVVLFVVGVCALSLVPSFSALPFYLDQAAQRVVLLALVAAFVAALGGARALLPRATGMRSALRLGSYPVLLTLALFALEALAIAGLVAEGGAGALSSTWAVDLAGVAALCASVGLFEEALCRVLLLGGLLSRHGSTRNGIVVSGLVSSVVFGAIHVTGSAGASLDPISLAQMLLKTLQAGSLGLLLAAVYVRTRSFLGIALIHALCDLLVMAPLALVGGGEEALGSYVTEGLGSSADLVLVAAAVALVVAYVVAVALYLPAALKGWRLLEATEPPQLGPFEAGWEPREDAGEKDARAEDGRPVPPAGLARP